MSLANRGSPHDRGRCCPRLRVGPVLWGCACADAYRTAIYSAALWRGDQHSLLHAAVHYDRSDRARERHDCPAGGADLRRSWAPLPAAVTLLTFAANRARLDR